MAEYKLAQMAKAAGWAAKIAPGDLEKALEGISQSDPRVLAGNAGDNEDAVVVRFPSGMALVQTVDFFTPVVNDPFAFGRIAAANALSDVYAMGAEPLSAMNIVCYPAKKMPHEILGAILRGGLDAVNEAGAVMAGGHSVEDDEIKYGLAISGVVDPAKISTNQGARPGEVLVLTKPLGTGVLATAVKAQWEGCEAMEAQLMHWCGKLSKAGGKAIADLGIAGATDITGFGFIGHVLDLANAGKVGLDITLSSVPFLDRARELAGIGLLPAGSICNRRHYEHGCVIEPGLDNLNVDLLFDAQTSGGLLLCVEPDKLAELTRRLEAAGDLAAVVGRVTEPRPQGEPPIHILS